MSRHAAFSCLCLVALASCGHGPSAEVRKAAQTEAKLQYFLDAGPPVRVPYSVWPQVVHPVAIRGPAGTRTVPGLFVADSEALAASFDSIVVAAAFDHGGALTGLLRFHGLSGQLDTLPAPRGLSPNLTAVAVSPDGRYVAYVEVDGADQPYGIVRRLSDQSEVLRTPPVAAAQTNAQIGFARWLSEDRVLLAVDADARRDRWVRFHGTVGGRLVQDTVAGGALVSAR